MRQDALERALRQILDQFEPSSPRCLDAYVDDGAGAVLRSVVVTDAMDDMLEAAEVLLNNSPDETEELQD